MSVSKLPNSSTDHLPVITNLKSNSIMDISKFKTKVTKRSLKNFSEEAWNACLARKNWSKIEECNDVDGMVKIFSKNIEGALDEIAPIKTFTIRSQYRFGLSDNTKKLMHDRDCTRGKIKNASSDEKKILHSKYKALRNKVTRNIREENIDFNNNRVNMAKNESELWKIANEVTNPKKASE